MSERHRSPADKLPHGHDCRKIAWLPPLIGLLFLEACSAPKGLPPVDSSKINPRLLDGTKMETKVDYDRRFAEHDIYVKTGSVLNDAKSFGLGVDDVQSMVDYLITTLFTTAYYDENEFQVLTGASEEELEGRVDIDRSEQGIARRRATRKLHAVFYEAKISYFSGEEVRELVGNVIKEVYGVAEVAAKNPSENPAE